MSASTYAHAKLCQPQFAPTAPGALVTNAAGQKTSVRLIILSNRSGSESVDYTLYHVPGAGGVPGAAGVAHGLTTETLLPHQSREFEYAGQGIYLDGAGDSIQVQASVASALACHVFGGREA